jgi:hypothetical protein
MLLVGFTGVVFSTPSASALAKYNLVQDNGFEGSSSSWVEFKNTDETTVSRHAAGGFEKSAGLIDLLKGLEDAPPQLLRFAYLSEELSKRNVSEVDSIYWLVKYTPAVVETSAAPYWFGVIVSGYSVSRGMCELKYIYQGNGAGVPPETDKEKNIILALPAKDTFYGEKRNLKEDWLRVGFSADAEILKIKLIACSMNDPATARPGGYGQAVWWDNLKLFSTRFDYDAAALKVLSGDQIKIGRSYIARAQVKNTGVYRATLKVACAIYQDQVKVFSDTTGGIILRNVAEDETREAEFKRWVPKTAGQYSIQITAILKEDQNPENNSIKENLKFVEEKTGGK